MFQQYDQVDHDDITWLNRIAFGGYEFPSYETLQQIRKKDDRVPPEVAWYVIVEGKPVAQVGYLIYPIKTTSGVQKAGVPYAVCTMPGFRQKGHGKAIMDYVHQQMLEHECIYSILSTSTSRVSFNWYKKLGYTVLAPLEIIYGKIQSSGVPNSNYSSRVRNDSDDDAIHKIFNSTQQSYFGFHSRNLEDIVIRELWDDKPIAIKILIDGNKIVGYVNIKQNHGTEVSEIVVAKDYNVTTWLKYLCNNQEVVLTISPHQFTEVEKIDGLTRVLGNGVMMIKDLTAKATQRDIQRSLGQDHNTFVAHSLDRW